MHRNLVINCYKYLLNKCVQTSTKCKTYFIGIILNKNQNIGTKMLDNYPSNY